MGVCWTTNKKQSNNGGGNGKKIEKKKKNWRNALATTTMTMTDESDRLSMAYTSTITLAGTHARKRWCIPKCCSFFFLLFIRFFCFTHFLVLFRRPSPIYDDNYDDYDVMCPANAFQLPFLFLFLLLLRLCVVTTHLWLWI